MLLLFFAHSMERIYNGFETDLERRRRQDKGCNMVLFDWCNTLEMKK